MVTISVSDTCTFPCGGSLWYGLLLYFGLQFDSARFRFWVGHPKQIMEIDMHSGPRLYFCQGGFCVQTCLLWPVFVSISYIRSIRPLNHCVFVIALKFCNIFMFRTIPSANNAKSQGVDIYCIGIPAKVNEVELREMSSGSQKINEVFVALQYDLSNSFPSSYSIVHSFLQKNIIPNPPNYLSWYDRCIKCWKQHKTLISKQTNGKVTQ